MLTPHKASAVNARFVDLLLHHLQSLHMSCPTTGPVVHLLPCTVVQAPGEPVWRQVLEPLLNDNDPEVAQQAAAALAE